jgi:hypothetical protein
MKSNKELVDELPITPTQAISVMCSRCFTPGNFLVLVQNLPDKEYLVTLQCRKCHAVFYLTGVEHDQL